MKSNYEERKQNRIDRYQSLAAKNGHLSQQFWNHSSKLASIIPMGQPILVGHHSEGAHRSLLNKIDNAMRKGCEASEKAGYYESKAKAAESNHAISSDNPEALDLLRQKLQILLDKQEKYKAVNKIVKSKKLSDLQKVEQIMAMNVLEEVAKKFIKPDDYGRFGIPAYVLSNNNGNISNIRKRIESLEKLGRVEFERIQFGNITLEIDPSDNRVKIFFPGKPADEIRAKLKSHGFHWSNFVGAWMRFLNPYAIHLAKEIIQSVNQ